MCGASFTAILGEILACSTFKNSRVNFSPVRVNLKNIIIKADPILCLRVYKISLLIYTFYFSSHNTALDDMMMADGIMLPGSADDPMALLRNDFNAVGGVGGTNMEPSSQQDFMYTSSQQNLNMDGGGVGGVGGGMPSTIPPTNFDSSQTTLENGSMFDTSGDGGGQVPGSGIGNTGGGIFAYNLPENAVFANPPPIASAPTNMRILIATDCHLGVRDREPLVADDALRTFEEVMQIAQHKDVDLILLAGDLFHQNRPSRQTVCRTVEILEKYCLGSRPVAVRFLSNPDEIFANVSDDPMFRRPNWEDPNINIELPIFSIHGNHDDPIGPKNLCELDALHTQRLINYFGKMGDIANIEIKPILLEKNGTFLALYGLGSMKDERLYHLLRKGMVKFIRPEPFECNGVRVAAEDMFSVLLFHQNRAARGGVGSTNYIPEHMLPEWMDLVVWGHEHDSIPRVVESPYVEESTGRITMRRVLQPGSTCTTSLSEGEALPKHVFMLELVGREWNVEAIKLLTVRPFFIQDVDLGRLNVTANAGAEGNETTTKKTATEDANQRETAVEEALAGLVEKCIVLAQQQHESEPRTPREPLVRLRVHFGKKDAPLNQKRFGQRFVGR
nr:MRE11 [Cornechiniscus lobatus]